MIRSRRSGRLVVVALMALLAAASSSAADLVLCLGPDGHRAFELQHPGPSCPTLASGGVGISTSPVAETLGACLDLPVVGGLNDSVTLSAESNRERTSAPALVVPIPSLAPRAQPPGNAPALSRQRAPSLARHLRSTILLV